MRQDVKTPDSAATAASVDLFLSLPSDLDYSNDLADCIGFHAHDGLIGVVVRGAQRTHFIVRADQRYVCVSQHSRCMKGCKLLSRDPHFTTVSAICGKISTNFVINDFDFLQAMAGICRFAVFSKVAYLSVFLAAIRARRMQTYQFHFSLSRKTVRFVFMRFALQIQQRIHLSVVPFRTTYHRRLPRLDVGGDTAGRRPGDAAFMHRALADCRRHIHTHMQ